MYIFIAMVVVGVVLYLFDLRDRKKGEEPEPVHQPQTDVCTDDCCSTNEVCPSDMLLAGIGKDAEYYDDEELDQFRGRDADSYSAEEEEQFRDVLYTLQRPDLLPWEQSIKKRGIILPRAIREEFIMLYSERTPSNN
ncbi:MAG: phospholipase [Bacteroidales bacterium]|nr:phospholipase [Bacteroidales bacterium]